MVLLGLAFVCLVLLSFYWGGGGAAPGPKWNHVELLGLWNVSTDTSNCSMLGQSFFPNYHDNRG